MRLMLPAERAELLHLQPFCRLLLVFRRAVIAALTFAACQLNDVSHGAYSMMSVTEPAPTVRPPSRIAKRAPFSSATGAISSTLTLVLSPGMIISTPSLRLSV